MVITIPVVDFLEVWGQSVRANLPAADEAAMVIEGQNAAHEFLKHSLCLVTEITQPLVDGEDTYEVNVVTSLPDPPDAVWGGVEGLYVHSFQIQGSPRPTHLVDGPPQHASTSPGRPLVGWCISPAVLQVLPVPGPNEDGLVLSIWSSLVPRRPISSLPKMLETYYFDAILSGTLGRMMAHPKRPYSDPKLAQYHALKFRNFMRVAKDETIRRWSNAERSFVFNRDWSHKPRQRLSR